MKHRVQIDISFEEEKEARDLVKYVEKIKKKAFKPKGDEKIHCVRKCRYHACTHDEESPQPCGGYEDLDFDN